MKCVANTACMEYAIWLDDEIDDWKRRGPEIICEVDHGGLVIMRPLLLHASAASASVDHRRVIHIEYACDDLPGPLQWNQRIGGAPAG